MKFDLAKHPVEGDGSVGHAGREDGHPDDVEHSGFIAISGRLFSRLAPPEIAFVGFFDILLRKVEFQPYAGSI